MDGSSRLGSGWEHVHLGPWRHGGPPDCVVRTRPPFLGPLGSCSRHPLFSDDSQGRWMLSVWYVTVSVALRDVVSFLLLKHFSTTRKHVCISCFVQ